MITQNRNFIRFTRSSVIIYPQIVNELRLNDLNMVDLKLYGNHDYYIAFIPTEYASMKQPQWRVLHNVNPNSKTLYTNNFTDLRGDYYIDNDVKVINELVYFKLKKIGEDDRIRFYQISKPSGN
jgi:hypothetical protein